MHEEDGKVKTNGYVYLRDHEVDMVKSVFQRHGYLHADFIVPNTLRA